MLSLHGRRRPMSITHGQYALTVLLAVASAQVFARAADRALCREIARFANASGDGAEHSVVLMNLWGTSDSDGNLLTQACRDESSSPPGERLCRYLTGNTGWEFQALNAWRVRGCLGDQRAAKPTQVDGADPREPGGSYRAGHVRGVSRGIWVMVDWGSGGAAETSDYPWLRITVRRHSPERFSPPP